MKPIDKVRKLYSLWNNGKVEVLKQHVVHPNLPVGSRENYLNFTLPVCLNFQRSSPAMWASALQTFNDNKISYLFFPEKVVREKREKVKKDLGKYRLALQTNKHTDIWIRISQTLNKFYKNDPRKVMEESDSDVVVILETLQKTKKSIFPFLGGIKLSNYWLYILSFYTDVKFKNINEISIIPDTHVIKATEKLGLTNGITKPEVVEKVWKELLEGTELSPAQLHGVLWNWSRAGFQPEV